MHTSLNIPDYLTFTENPAEALKIQLDKLRPDKVAYLVDEHTQALCLPLLQLPDDALIITIQSGEIHKTLDTCMDIWGFLTDHGFGRKSLLVNVGGGVIGDMGGFAAATYKRGIRFVNFPTTLLAAVDANTGGKLGIDFRGFKNHIGIFQDPTAVIITDRFFDTLPERELRSGFAEVIKHGLIYDQAYFEAIKTGTFPDFDWIAIIRRSVQIKGVVVEQDPKEAGLRKILNFGHTLGHGIETWYLTHERSLLHGEAVAVGMCLEAYLAYKKGQLSLDDTQMITRYLISVFGKVELPPLEEILPLMQHDKKNQGNQISFSLIDGIGKCSFDAEVNPDWIPEAYRFYQAIK